MAGQRHFRVAFQVKVLEGGISVNLYDGPSASPLHILTHTGRETETTDD